MKESGFVLIRTILVGSVVVFYFVSLKSNEEHEPSKS